MAANLAAKAERAAAEAEARSKSTLSNAHLEAGNSMWGTSGGGDGGGVPGGDGGAAAAAELDPAKVAAAMKKLDAAEAAALADAADERKRKVCLGGDWVSGVGCSRRHRCPRSPSVTLLLSTTQPLTPLPTRRLCRAPPPPPPPHTHTSPPPPPISTRVWTRMTPTTSLRRRWRRTG